MKVPQVGHVTVIDAQTIKIEPRDKTQTKYIEKAVYDSASGLTPQNEGDYIYIKIPALTEERRKQIAKQVKEMREDIKARVRMTRQDAMKETKKSFDDKEIGEDEHKRNEKEIDALVKDMNMSIDQLTHNKAEEVMKV
jgi:ribosome recycling factor